MPKITSVEPQKKNPHRFNIYLDGQFAFGADEDLVVDYRLIPGKVIDQPLLKKLLFEAEAGELMERMYDLFNRRQRTEKEVREYLRQLSFKRKIKNQDELSPISVDLVVERLKKKRLLNDEEFAKQWMESRSKKKGIQAIKGELFKKGINREIIDEVTRVEDIESRQENIAEQLLIKRLPRFKSSSYLERKKKAYEFLLRRGFEYEIVKEVVEKLLRRGYNN